MEISLIIIAVLIIVIIILLIKNKRHRKAYHSLWLKSLSNSAENQRLKQELKTK